MVATPLGMDNSHVVILKVCYTYFVLAYASTNQTVIMFKRVFLVLTLLFAQSAFGQEVTLELNALDENAQASSSPVVAVESATGSVEQDEQATSSKVTTSLPAEVNEVKVEASSSSLIVTELGALGTSSTSEATTTVETEESTSTTPIQEEADDKFFSLAFAGFEKFVETFFGWE